MYILVFHTHLSPTFDLQHKLLQQNLISHLLFAFVDKCLALYLMLLHIYLYRGRDGDVKCACDEKYPARLTSGSYLAT